MITNKYEIEIEQIRDLSTINLVDLTDDIVSDTNNRLTLIVSYGNKQNIKYNYLDEHFPLLLRKVVELYSKSPNKKDILLIGDYTKKVLGDLENLYKQIDNNKEIPYVQDYPIVENSTQRFNIKIIEGIIKDLSKSLIFLDTDTVGYNYTGVKGFKDRYSITYQKNNKEYFIPISINKDAKNYKFKVGAIAKNVFNINGNIVFYDKSVIASWIDNSSKLKGNISYSLDPLKEQNIVKFEENIVGMQKKETTFSTKDNDLIKLYSSLYDINISKLNKCSENIYISESENIKDNTSIIQNGYFYIDKEVVNIKLKTKRNLKYDDHYSFFLENEDIDIILREVNIDDKKYILEQINYLPTRSTGEYKYFFQNKYNYKLYEINNEGSLNKGFEIKNIINIDNTINSVDDLNNILKSHTKGVKKYGVI